MNNIIPQIRDGICELEAKGCKQEDMIIAYSPLIEHFLILSSKHMGIMVYAVKDIETFETIYGVKTYNLHPYNEIVIYDYKNTSLHEDLIFKIDSKQINGTIV